MDNEFVEKQYKYMHNGASVEDFMHKFHMNFDELYGLLELCRIYGKMIDVEEKDGVLVFVKPINRSWNNKLDLDPTNLIHTQFGVVSDTHVGNIHQQFHLLNQFYREAYNRGIKKVYHVGDIVDGNYPNRPEQPRQQFLHGFDEQVSYVVDMYPKVRGITTEYILGSHDETHYKNGQATVNNWLSRCRKDMVFLGQDCALTELNGVKIFLDHPGGGSAQSLSYKPQKRIETLESEHKPKILLIGHYHKSYYFVYRNVHGLLVPSLCDKTQFQQKQGLYNYVGAYFIDMYSDKDCNVKFFSPEEIIYGPNDMWDEAGKDYSRVKKLVIK